MDEDDVYEGSVDKNMVVGPVTIWIGVSRDTTSAMAAHGAAQDVLALLKDYKITDVDVDFRESTYVREAGPRLHKPVGDLNPHVDVVSPLTPALGLSIQGTMAVYLAEGGDSNRLLGLTCRHVLFPAKDNNVDCIYSPGAPAKKCTPAWQGSLQKPRRFDETHDRWSRYCNTALEESDC